MFLWCHILWSKDKWLSMYCCENNRAAFTNLRAMSACYYHCAVMKNSHKIKRFRYLKVHIRKHIYARGMMKHIIKIVRLYRFDHAPTFMYFHSRLLITWFWIKKKNNFHLFKANLTFYKMVQPENNHYR